MEENNTQINEHTEWNQVPGRSQYQPTRPHPLQPLKSKKLMKKIDNNRGYWIYRCRKDGDNRPQRSHALSAHRAVALAWIPNPNNYPIVNHKDENKRNNYYKNLEWCTYSYNNTYNGIKEKGTQKIISKRGIPVFIYDLDGNFVKKTSCINEAKRFLSAGIENNLNSILKKNQNKEGFLYTCRGYICSTIQLTKEEIIKRKVKISNLSEYAKENFSKVVYQYDTESNLIKIHQGINQVAKTLGIPITTFRYHCKKQDIYKGYIWSYVPLHDEDIREDI